MKYTEKAGVRTPVLLLSNCIVPSVASTLAALSVVAGAEPNSPAVLSEIVVTAARLPEGTIPLAEFPASVTVVTREQIAQSPAFNVTELLRQQVGFTSTDSIGFGVQTSTFSLRGYGEKAGTLVLLDGVKINDPGNDYFSGNSIPIESIERIELIRGGASTTYGNGALAGVINVITRKPDSLPLTGSVGARLGNLGYNQNDFTLSGSQNELSYLFSGSRSERNGWKDFSGFNGKNFLAKPSLETPWGRFTLNYQFAQEYSESSSALSAAQFFSNPRQRGSGLYTFDQETHRTWLDYRSNSGGALSVNAKLFYTKDDSHSSYNDPSFGSGNYFTNQPSYGAIFQGDWKTRVWSHENTFTLGAEAGRQDFTQLSDGAFGSKNIFDSTTYGLFTQDSLKLINKVRLTMGARYDQRRAFLDVPSAFPAYRGSRKNAVWSPKVSLNYEIADKTSSWLSYSQSYHLPTANDVVSGDPHFTSNPTIVPTKARTLEVGARTDRHKFVGGSLTVYRSWVTDDLFYNPTTFGNENANAIRQGAELGIDVHPAAWIDLDFGAAYTDAHFTTGSYRSKRHVLVPKWDFKSGVTIRPGQGWSWRWEVSHPTGMVRTNDPSNSVPQTSYTVVNTKVSYEWYRYLSYVAVNNLFNRTYEQFPTYSATKGIRYNPAPGFNFQVGVKVDF